MRLSPLLLALAASVTALPAAAQTTAGAASTVAPAPVGPARELPADRGYDKPSPRTDAINAVEGPVTDGLNAQANAAAATSVAADAAMTAEQQAQYAADRDAYWAALVQHDRAVQRTDTRYARQQNAYADAMYAWRVQAAACKRGNRKACDAPAPNPADFY